MTLSITGLQLRRAVATRRSEADGWVAFVRMWSMHARQLPRSHATVSAAGLLACLSASVQALL